MSKCLKYLMDKEHYEKTGEIRMLEILDEDFQPLDPCTAPPSEPTTEGSSEEANQEPKPKHRLHITTNPIRANKYDKFKSDCDRDKLLSLLVSGKSHNDIAKEFGVNSSYVFKLRAEYKITPEEFKARKNENNPKEEEEMSVKALMKKVSREELIVLLANKKQKDIAVDLGVKAALVSQLKNKYKITDIEVQNKRDEISCFAEDRQGENLDTEIEVTKTELEPAKVEVDHMVEVLQTGFEVEVANDSVEDELVNGFGADIEISETPNEGLVESGNDQATDEENCTCNCKCAHREPGDPKSVIKMTVYDAITESVRLKGSLQIMTNLREFLNSDKFVIDSDIESDSFDHVDDLLDQCIHGMEVRKEAMNKALEETVIVIPGARNAS